MTLKLWLHDKHVMQAVIDTNVVVSAVINPRGTPARVIEEIRAFVLIPVVSPAILAEYTEVLRRARFGFPSELVDRLLDDLSALALHIVPNAQIPANLPDPGDAPFIATAKTAACPIVTGNGRHFPAECGVLILSPAECLARISAG
ncbi:MAG: putative toxin-antitoxin system toxin component, PIN family [Sulfuriferula sp.]